ncbi:MAG TPA: hypothetical protein PKY78_01290 [Candidatus Omnitrophota bacterium]|mgnify:CR=1 FL=1|nr:hypothetical protein [Candidatus Omnitrophota bacterium]HPS19614.1 hypothetical protein [Candidatus Omnitrophota bacterium]
MAIILLFFMGLIILLLAILFLPLAVRFFGPRESLRKQISDKAILPPLPKIIIQDIIQVVMVVLTVSLISIIIVYKSANPSKDSDKKSNLTVHKKNIPAEIGKSINLPPKTTNVHDAKGGITAGQKNPFMNTGQTPPSALTESPTRPATVPVSGGSNSGGGISGASGADKKTDEKDEPNLSEDGSALLSPFQDNKKNIPLQDKGTVEGSSRAQESIIDIKPISNVFVPESEKLTAPTPVKKNEEISISGAIAKVSNAQITDYFVYSFFDHLTDGRFARSESLSFVPPLITGSSSQPISLSGAKTISIQMQIPSLSTDQSIQLPFLLNGITSQDESILRDFDITPNGILSALTNTAPRTYEYKISKKNGCGKFINIQHDPTGWLEKEFADIPAEIQEILWKNKNSTEDNKLFAVATIMNKFFAYQAGGTDIYLEHQKTWNSMLSEKISTGEPFICDCDILTTYSFIYLSYLDLSPVMLVGFFPLDKNGEKTLSIEEMHATLFLGTQKGWIIFEPTLFSPHIDRMELDEGSTSDDNGTDIESGSLAVKETRNKNTSTMKEASENMALPFFMPNITDTKTAATPEADTLGLDRIKKRIFGIIQDITSQVQNSSIDTFTSKKDTSAYSTVIAKIEAILFLFGLILAKILSQIRFKQKSLLYVGTLPSLFFIFGISIITLGIFYPSLNNSLVFTPFRNQPCEMAGLILMAFGGMTSISACIGFIPTEQNQIISFFRDKKIFVMSFAIFGTGAFLYTASLPIAGISLLALIIVILDRSARK